MKHFLGIYFALTIFLMVLIFVPLGFSQQNLAQQAYAIFQQSCLNCHGEHGAFTEAIVMDHTFLIETGAVVPGNPIASSIYQRLVAKDPGKRMPLGQPQLSQSQTILTIRQLDSSTGAPDWVNDFSDRQIVPSLHPKQCLKPLRRHVNSLSAFDRTFTRYFTLTHLYNAGESNAALRKPINAHFLNSSTVLVLGTRGHQTESLLIQKQTVFYIDLRDYEWEIGTNRWAQIEQVLIRISI